MHPDDKEAFLRRALRAGAKEPSYEEKKRRRERARSSKSERSRERPRRHDWDELDDGEDERARARRAGGGRDARVVVDGTVVGVVRATVRVRIGERFVDALRARGAREVAGDAVRVALGPGESARVLEVAPRRTVLARTDPSAPQAALVLAANIDLVAIVGSVIAPPLREGLVARIAIAAERGGACALVCINKVDLLARAAPEPPSAAAPRPLSAARDVDAARVELDEAVRTWTELGFEVHLCSAATGAGIDRLRARLDGARTAFVGHSGVGKSSLVNALARAPLRDTGDVRAHDGRGRHTTSSAALLELWPGAEIVDTPGVRAFGLGLGARELRDALPDVAALAHGCRFSDCRHLAEPGCAVRAAVEEGRLAARRLELHARLIASASSTPRPRRE